MSLRLSALVIALLVRTAAAECTTDADCIAREHEPAPPTGKQRALAVTAAIVPGVLLHGSGSWLVDRKRTAKRLAKLEAIGLGGMLVGGLPVGVTGGNPYSIIGVPVLLVGAGLFTASWWADIGVAAGLDQRHASARAAPPWSLELATLWLHDPYRERGLGRVIGEVELGRVGVGGELMVDAENQARDAALEVRGRILGAPATGAPIADGSRLYVRSALRVHHDDDDRVTLTTGEVEAVGRLDLAHVDELLGGTFLQLSTGLGVERAKYANDVHDHDSLLLGTFTWGVYLGNRGEIGAYYDHRRDSIVGGLAAWRAAGFVGSLGAYTDVVVGPHWAVRGQLDWGNAVMSTLAVRYRGGR